MRCKVISKVHSKHISRVLAIFFLFLIAFNLVPFPVPTPTTTSSRATLIPSSGWQYVKQLNISDSGGNSADYQMRLTVYAGEGTDNPSEGIVYCDNHCSDFPNDIRFGTTDDPSTAEQLPQWIESYNSTQAIVWVKLPSDGSDTIYMFVGNSAASLYSDGDNTFILFDDFEDDTVGQAPSGWTIESGTWTVENNPSGEGKVLRADMTPSSTSAVIHKSMSTMMTFRWYFKWYVTYDRDNYIQTYIDGGTSVSSKGLTIKREDSIDKLQYYDGSSYQNYETQTVISLNTWYSMRIDFKSSTTHECYVDGIEQGQGGFWHNPSSGHSAIIFYVPNNTPGYTYYDNVFLAKYASTPPTWSSFGDWTSITTTEAIIISSPYPSNDDTSISFSPIDGIQTSITVSHIDGKTMDIYWYWKNGTTWELYGQNLSVTNGTYRMWNNHFIDSSTTYYWSVNVTDNDGNWTNQSYSFTTDTKPFLLPNNENYYTTVAHFGYGETNQWIHPDILYFPEGWGNVNGTTYKYWMTVSGYHDSNKYYEQPIILCANNVTNDSWVEPAGNYYNTNPLTGWYYSSGDGHYDDSDIVYNDDTNELWVYYLNTSKPDQWVELVKSSDGVNWSEPINISEYSPILFYNDGANGNGFIVSPAIIKEGDNWLMWAINTTNDPNDLILYNSTDGLHWYFKHNCGHDFVTDSSWDAWHINVVKYNGTYWGLLAECPSGNSGDGARLALIKSEDGENWTGYDGHIMTVSSSGWDNDLIYRSACLIQDGNLTVIYCGRDTTHKWHTSWTYTATFGGSGYSNNIIFIENYSPQLSNPSASPSSGVADCTIFYFNITYSDPDGDPPTEIKVNISKTGWYLNASMTYISGDNTTGALYSYNTTLSAGTYDYLFYASDGTYSTVNDPTDQVTVEAQSYSFTVSTADPSGQENFTASATMGAEWNVSASYQTSSLPAIQITNTGNVPINISINLTTTPISNVHIKYNTSSTPPSFTQNPYYCDKELTTTPVTVFTIGVGETGDIWLWADFENKTNPGSYTTELYISSTFGG